MSIHEQDKNKDPFEEQLSRMLTQKAETMNIEKKSISQLKAIAKDEQTTKWYSFFNSPVNVGAIAFSVLAIAGITYFATNAKDESTLIATDIDQDKKVEEDNKDENQDKKDEDIKEDDTTDTSITENVDDKTAAVIDKATDPTYPKELFFDGILVAWVDDKGNWQTGRDRPDSVPAELTKVNVNGVAGSKIDSTGKEFESFCELAPDSKMVIIPGIADGVAVSNYTEHNRKISPENISEAITNDVYNILKEAGRDDTDGNKLKAKAYRVDLDNNGTTEVVVTAASDSGEFEGGWFVLYVRRVVDGELQIEKLGVLDDNFFYGDPSIEIVAFTDLNQDGYLEIVAMDVAIEGSGVDIYDTKTNKSISRIGCGA